VVYVQECARYLETVKVYETKAPDAIQGRTEEDYLSRFTAAITTVRGVNRTDVLTLGRTFGSLAGTMQVRRISQQDEQPHCHHGLCEDNGHVSDIMSTAGIVPGDVDMPWHWADKSSPLA